MPKEAQVVANPLRLRQVGRGDQENIFRVELKFKVTNIELDQLLAIQDDYNQRILTLGLYPSATIGTVVRTLIAKEWAALNATNEVPIVVKDATEDTPPKVSAKPRSQVNPKVPRLIDSLQIVIGKNSIRAPEILAELEKRGWVPDSKDPLGWIRFTLSSEDNLFKKVPGTKGTYCLDPSNPNYK